MPNNQESEFHDRLYDYESPVDAEATWRAINANLHPPRKRRGGWWWLFGLLLISTAGVGVYYLTAGSATPEQPTARTADPADSGQPTELALAPNEIEGQELTEDSQAASKETASLPAQPSINRTTQTNASRPVAPVAAAPAAARAERRPSVGASKAAGVGANPVATALTPTPEKVVNSSPSTPGATVLTNDQQTLAADGVNAVNGQASTRDSPTLSDNQQTQTAGNTNAGIPQHAMVSVPTLTNKLLPTTATPTPETPLPETFEIIECTFAPARQREWSIGLETTVSNIGQTFSGGVEQASGMLLPLYEETIRPLEAISTDLLLGYQTRSNWTLRGGLGLTVINTVAESITITRNDSVEVEGITRIDINAAGDSSFVTGTVMGSEIITRQQQYYNTLTLIDIPLLVGRHFTFRKFDLYLEAGPVVNLSARASARLPLAEGLFSERADNEGQVRSSLGLSWRGQLSAGYRLTNHLSLTAGIDYRQLPRRGIAAEGTPVITRYDLLGGKLGLRYWF